jgi:phosphoglycerate dehydrogenase-like enzyme
VARRARAFDMDVLAIRRDVDAEGRLAGAALDVWYRYPTSAAPTLPAHQPLNEIALAA